MKPVVDRLQDQYGGEIDFQLYFEVDKDSSAGRLAASKGVNAVPTMVLVSAEGTEIKRWVGAQSEGELAQEFDAALDAR